MRERQDVGEASPGCEGKRKSREYENKIMAWETRKLKCGGTLGEREALA